MIFAILILCVLAVYAIYDYKIGVPNNAMSNINVDDEEFLCDSFDPNDPSSSVYVKGYSHIHGLYN